MYFRGSFTGNPRLFPSIIATDVLDKFFWVVRADFGTPRRVSAKRYGRLNELYQSSRHFLLPNRMRKNSFRLLNDKSTSRLEALHGIAGPWAYISLPPDLGVAGVQKSFSAAC